MPQAGMQILFVTPYYHPEAQFGGPPAKIHSLSRGLNALNSQVRVLTFHSEKPRGEETTFLDGVEVQRLSWVGSGLKQWPTDLARIRQAIAKSDLVHCYGIYNLLCPIVGFFARQRGLPVVLEPLGMYPARTGNLIAKHLYNATFTRLMAGGAIALVAASPSEVSDLKKLAPANQIIYRRNGVDLGKFKTLPRGDVLRTKWGIENGEKVVLYIGRISPIKNIEQLILAFAKCNVPASRLVLVGPTDDQAFELRLRELIAQRNLGFRVLFAGPLYEEDQRAALSCADLFVLPSLSESFGNAAAEAVAADVPVLLTETCGIAPIIHERAGFAVPLGVDSLAKGLELMLSDSGFRAQVIAKREEAKRDLSWEEPVQQTEELYKSILAKRPSTAQK